MKNIYKKYEMLSAYLDNELSDADIKKIEDELKFSQELQEKLVELKKVKQLTISHYKSVAENPFFDTKLAATMRTGKHWSLKIRKYAPVMGIVAISLFLMILLKYNPAIIRNIVEEQKTNISSFYKENLKPLLYTANLNNDDIFNFAFYHQLPLDNQKKQILQLGADNNGNQFFEIKQAGIMPSQNSLEKFAKVLKLNDKQKIEIDSILQSYAVDLQNQILVNNSNTVAINPNLWNFNKALTADLIAFAARINNKQIAKAIPPGFEKYYNNGGIAKAVSQIKSSGNDKYIFLTPDSIFSESFYFDKGKFKNEMKKWTEELNRNMNDVDKQMQNLNFSVYFGKDFTKFKNDSSRDKEFKVFIDSNSCRVHFSKLFIPNITIPNIDSIISHIDSATGIFKSFAFRIPEHKGKNFNYKYFYKDSTKNYKFNFKSFGFDSSFSGNHKRSDSVFLSKFKNFNFPMNPDSMASMYKFFYKDSSNIRQQKMLQEQMHEFQKEIEQFRKEMEQWQKQFHNNQKTPTGKSPVEI